MFLCFAGFLCCFAEQEHIDYLSLQSLLFKQTSLGFVGQLKIFFKHTKRISD